MVGLHGNLPRRLARAPLPVAAVLHALGQLRDEGDVGAVGRDGLRAVGRVVVFQAAQIGLVLQGLAIIDDIAREGSDGLFGRDGRAPAGER